jgi:hypothetical protein
MQKSHSKGVVGKFFFSKMVIGLMKIPVCLGYLEARATARTTVTATATV